MTAIGIGAVVILLALVAVVAKLHDLRNKREGEALALQSRLSDAMLTDPALRGITVSPTVHVPVRRSAPIQVAVSGEVPGPEARDTVLRRLRQELGAAGREVEIDDRMTVLASPSAVHAA